VSENGKSGPEIVVLLRRLCGSPRHVAEDAVMGQCERAALASALILRSELGGRVTAAALGPASREDRVLAMALRAGCDGAVRVWDAETADLDYLGVARVLAAVADRVGYDLVIVGDRSQDEGQGATGPAVAQLLGVPHLGRLVGLRGDDGAVVVTQRSGGKLYDLRTGFPAVLCVARLPADRRPPGDLAPGRGSIEERDLPSLGLDPRALAHRRRFLGIARATRPGPNATMLTSPRELAERLFGEA